MDKVLQFQGAHAASTAAHVAVVVAPVVAATAMAIVLECLVGGVVGCPIVALCAVNVGVVGEHHVRQHHQLQQQQQHHQRPHRQQLDPQRDCSHLCYHRQQWQLIDFECLSRQAALMMIMDGLMKKLMNDT